MKRIMLIIVCVLASIYGAYAQKIHWLLFIDTDDANVGQLDVNGRNYLRANFVDIVNTALKGSYLPDIYDNYGANCNPYKCKSVVQDLRCGSEDIVIFYYIGHGGRSVVENDREHPWPKMWLGQNDPTKMVDLGWVHEQLKAKNPRLLLTIGMCCNVKQNLPSNRTPSFSVNYGSYSGSAEEYAHIKDIFTNTCGSMIATSAKPGQSSIGGEFSNVIKPMDIYTALLCLNFRELYEDRNLDIESLFKITKEDVDRITEQEQTPIFQSQLGRGQCNTIAANNNCRQMPTTVNINDMTDLEYLMEAVVCNKTDIPNRSNYFDNNCVVRIIGQDGRTQVDRVSINSYMLRARTSTALQRIVPVGTMVNDGKIKEFYVREYYKR